MGRNIQGNRSDLTVEKKNELKRIGPTKQKWEPLNMDPN